MHGRVRGLCALLSACVVAVAVAACGGGGGSSQNASTLLKQTFSGSHVVNSGNLSFSLTIAPSGSSKISGPITLSFGGPFQSLGKGKLPKSNFNVSISALGHTGTLGILSTGTAGYISMDGTSYQMPAATFQKLESSFASLASSPGSSGTGALGKLGIDPLHWLVHPTVAGSETIAGTSTTHIRAGIDVSALLRDLNTFLGKASSLGVSGSTTVPTSISSATQTKIASEVQNPSFDVWTGSSDKTVRKLSIGLTLPISGQLSTLLGGLSSAGITLTMQYGDLNQTQNIVAPTTVAPYSQFTTKIQEILQAVESALGSALPAGSGSSTSSLGATGSSGSSSSSSGSGTSTTVDSYSSCIQAAGSNVAKMQRCSSLLNGSGG
jgi:hypothetical protein